jgi:type IV secretion system protein VirD4
LEEFPNLGRFNEYEKFLATCRGYGIACCTILQNITQLQERYGREQAESILGNCGVKLCLGNVNNTTAKYFSELAGKTTVKVETSSKSTSKGNKSDSSSSSQNFSYTGRNLINADEIEHMDRDESILIITGKYPIKLKKAKQFELFPGITDAYRCSQGDYKRKMTDEVKVFRKTKKIEYEAYISSNEKQEEQKENEKKIHEDKIRNVDKKEKDEINATKSFFTKRS